jgi:heterotetrameric sarcosine oxidase gamma subunit
VSDSVIAPVAHSPITLPATRVARGGPTLADLSLLAKVAVRAPAGGAVQDALGVGFGRASRSSTGPLAGVLVVGSGPGQWLLLGAESLIELAECVLAGTGEFATCVDVGHGRALVRLTGSAAPALLAKVCGIDLADRGVPDGAAFRSSVARVVTDVVRDDIGDGPEDRSYLLHCERSSGHYLAESLIEAGREFGLVTQ